MKVFMNKNISNIFDKEIQKRNIKPTKLLPLWDFMGITLGFGTAMLGKKAAMLCTASVEEVIDGHYKDQTYKLQEDEKELKEKIKKFRNDELHHKDIAYEQGATKTGFYNILDKVIKTSSRIAIVISKRFKVLIQYPNINNPSSFRAKNLVESFCHFYVRSSTVGL